jgi:putative addiction module component (TIGR02574 family)
MTDAARTVLEQALKLSASERLELARELIGSVEPGSVDDGLAPAWIEEIERRVKDVVAGEAGPDEDWRVVLDRVRRRPRPR